MKQMLTKSSFYVSTFSIYIYLLIWTAICFVIRLF